MQSLFTHGHGEVQVYSGQLKVYNSTIRASFQNSITPLTGLNENWVLV